jgi:hypothetical protein
MWAAIHSCPSFAISPPIALKAGTRRIIGESVW